MESYVARQFDFDFIYFDLLFAAIWMLLLWRRKQTLALGFGLAGAVIVFLADDVLWFHIQKTRSIDSPITILSNQEIFQTELSCQLFRITFSSKFLDEQGSITNMLPERNYRHIAIPLLPDSSG